MKEEYKMGKKTPKQALKAIARKEGKSVEEIRREIEAALRISRENPDPKIQAFWDTVPSKGAKPTPEKAIAHMAKIVENRQDKD